MADNHADKVEMFMSISGTLCFLLILILVSYIQFLTGANPLRPTSILSAGVTDIHKATQILELHSYDINVGRCMYPSRYFIYILIHHHNLCRALSTLL